MVNFFKISRTEKRLFFSRLIVVLSIFVTIGSLQMSLLVDELQAYHYVIPLLLSSFIGSFIGWNAVLKHRLEKSNRVKSDFLASISHELRTPLTVIIGFSKIMTEMEDLNIRGHEFAYRIHLSGEHLLSFVNNFLDTSAIESGTLSLNITQLSLNNLIHECVLLMTPVAKEQGVSLDLSLTDKNIIFAIDELRLKQVILNLISNSIKYNTENGNVSITLEEYEAHHYRISIEDTGIGIPASLHKKIFTQFERLDQNTSSIRGSGLGLTISKSLIILMGGSLDFSSEQGVGSKFWIDIHD